MGPQAAISCDSSPKLIELSDGQALSIPEGQFALLLTEEVVKLPADTLAFISLKTSVKCQGLVNVSGFHVDPGFEGRLKFWVYNAGPKEIFLRRGEPTFLIWFCDFDEPVEDPYKNRGAEQMTITAKNLNDMRGAVCSPSALGAKVSKLEERMTQVIGATGALILLALGIFVSILMFALETMKEPSSPTEVHVRWSDGRGATQVTPQSEAASSPLRLIVPSPPPDSTPASQGAADEIPSKPQKP